MLLGSPHKSAGHICMDISIAVETMQPHRGPLQLLLLRLELLR